MPNRFLKRAKRLANRLLFEENCIRCGSFLSTNPFFCDRCLGSVTPKLEEDLISIPYLDGYRTFTTYGEVEKLLVHLIKFEGVRSLTQFVGEIAAPYLKGYTEKIKPDAVTYVPTNPWRFWFLRGFEPVLEFLRPSKVEAKKLIKRSWKPRKPLSRSKNVAERRRLVKGVYSLLGNVENKTVLIVDDILTTGTTASEIAYLMKSAKAKRVYLFAYFRV